MGADDFHFSKPSHDGSVTLYRASDGGNRSRTRSEDKTTDSIESVTAGGKRHDFRWSQEARELVRANLRASGAELSLLISRLVQLSGYPRWACLRFARRMGLQSKKQLKPWTTQEQQRLLKLIDLHPVKEVAKLMRRSHSSVWHMMYRLGANAQMGKDSFTKYTLAAALQVSPQKIEDWIERGWLEAREIVAGSGKRTVIDGEAFCDFCKKHTKDVIGNRLKKERLEFVYHFAFPANHAELLPVRASKKEQNAYEEQIGQQHIKSTQDCRKSQEVSHDENTGDFSLTA